MKMISTLDDELAALLKEKAYRSGKSFRALVNETLRAGLMAQNVPPKPNRLWQKSDRAESGPFPPALRYEISQDHQYFCDFKPRAGEKSSTLSCGALSPQPAKPYRLRSGSLGGALPVMDLNKALRLADALEDESVARKLALRE